MANIFQRIKKIEIQGAINIAEESLKYLRKYAKKHGFGSGFNKQCDKLLKTRPTAVPLFNVINMVKRSKSEKTINELLSLIKRSKEKIARQRLFKKKSVVMTHCHSSEVMSLLKKNRSRIKKIIVTETRPKYQGLLTAKELAGVIPVTYIVDSAVMQFIKETDMMIVGSDSINKKGAVNKIGTHLMAIAAKEFNVPFYVVASTIKYDKRKKFVIEERNPNEICGLKNIRIRNPIDRYHLSESCLVLCNRISLVNITSSVFPRSFISA